MGIQEVINSRTFDQVVFCNFCHQGPAAGWLEVEDEDGAKAARAACLACAEKEGLIMNGDVINAEL